MGCEKAINPPRHHQKCSDFYDLKREQCDILEDFVTKIEPYRVIFIGDHHDAKALHVTIAHLITTLQKRGYHIALANEWFTPEDNAILAQYAKKMMDDKTFQDTIDWKKKAGYSFESFAPIYKAIQEGEGLLYGINLTREERQAISDKNVSAMDPKLREFYENLDLKTQSHYELMAPFLEHCHSSKKGEDALTCKERMYRVQVAWDSKMAVESAALAHEVLQSPKDKLIVFAGAFHLSSHLGIDMRFSRQNPALHVTLLPLLKPQESIDLGYADFVYFYDSDDKNISKSANTL